MSIIVRRLLESELAWANGRYEEVRFPPSPPQDFIAAAEVDNVKAGLGRLVPIDAGCGELGGIFVLPAFRGGGVANAVVSFLLENSRYRTLFCIPYAKLDAFYRGFGFRSVAAGTAVPDVVSEKLNWCAKQYSDPVCLLVRGVSSQGGKGIPTIGTPPVTGW